MQCIRHAVLLSIRETYSKPQRAQNTLEIRCAQRHFCRGDGEAGVDVLRGEVGDKVMVAFPKLQDTPAARVRSDVVGDANGRPIAGHDELGKGCRGTQNLRHLGSEMIRKPSQICVVLNETATHLDHSGIA
eukprot:3789673-Alexandrium_andersonii.AAC.1